MGRIEKSQNGFFTIESKGRELSRSILRFEIGSTKTKLWQFEDFGRQWNHEWSAGIDSNSKYQNGFFHMIYSRINDSKTSFIFVFGLVKLILSNAHPPPYVGVC